MLIFPNTSDFYIVLGYGTAVKDLNYVVIKRERQYTIFATHKTKLKKYIQRKTIKVSKDHSPWPARWITK